MLYVLSWWLALELLGLVAIPFAFLLFPRLPDRGLAFTKVLGVLFLGYLLWLSGILHLLPNGRGAAFFSAFLLAIGALLLAGRQRGELGAFIRREYRTLIVYEVAFAVAFAAWAFIRAYNPQIDSTEKPMDFMLLNSMIKATSFPPQDPWLSGFTVNYYYFGYLLMASLAQLTGTPSAVGFNLALAFLFAATCLGTWGLVTNLVALHRAHHVQQPQALSSGPALAVGALGAFFVGVMGNLEGVLEMVRAHGGGSDAFWRWVGVQGLEQPYVSETWYPTDTWWWWRATRVIDTIVGGRSQDYTITEFPFFSFLLGDLHPHVLALPFVLVVVGLSLNLLPGPAPRVREWVRVFPIQAFLTLVAVGSIGFINGWDFAPYLALFLAAGALRWWMETPKATCKNWLDLVGWAGIVAGGSVLLYAPFYGQLGWQVATSLLAGQSEAAVSGFPVGWWNGPGTRPLHFLLLWKPFLFLASTFLIAAAWSRARSLLPWVLGMIACVVGIWIALEAGMVMLPSEGPALWLSSLLKRTWFLGPLVAASVLLLNYLKVGASDDAEQRDSSAVTAFVMTLVAGTFLLFAVSESFRIKDVFGNRMNTVFKLYYQAWLLLAVAGAFTVYYVNAAWTTQRATFKVARALWNSVLVVLLAASSVYSIAAVLSKTEAFNGSPTLDGLAYLKGIDPAEAEALQWLSNQPQQAGTVILEATGGQYTHFGRVSSNTGIPTVLGWAGHEVQWRGSDKAFRGRAEDIDRIYAALDKTQVIPILEQYAVDYIYVGALERTKYPTEALAAFQGAFKVAFSNNGVVIYRTPEAGRGG